MKKKKDYSEKFANQRLTAIDILICLVVISTIIYIGIRFFISDNSNKTVNVEYKTKILISEDKKDVFKKGDIVLSPNGEKIIGEITEISFEPAKQINFDLTVSYDNIYSNNTEFESEEIIDDESEKANDNLEESSVLDEASSEETYEENSEEISKEKTILNEVIIEGYYQVTITVSAQLMYNDGAYYLGNEKLKLGEETNITTKNYSSSGNCIYISEKDDIQEGL